MVSLDHQMAMNKFLFVIQGVGRQTQCSYLLVPPQTTRELGAPAQGTEHREPLPSQAWITRHSVGSRGLGAQGGSTNWLLVGPQVSSAPPDLVAALCGQL